MDAAPKKMIRRAAPTLALLAAFGAQTIALPCPAAAYDFAAADSAVEGASERLSRGPARARRERWSDAARTFAAVAAAGGADADAALYWRSYADWKRQARRRRSRGCASSSPRTRSRPGSTTRARSSSRSAAAARARGTPPRSRRRGAQALRPRRPDAHRARAGGAGARADPRRPAVARAQGARALRALAERLAAGAGDPAPHRPHRHPVELRVEAVRSLGIAGEEEDIATLAQIASDKAAPREVREAVLEAYLIADREADSPRWRATSPIRSCAQGDRDARRDGALPALRELWSAEKDPEVRHKLLEAFGIAGDADRSSPRARARPDPRVRHKAIEGLVIADVPPDANRALLLDLYRTLADPGDRRKVLEAFMIQGDAEDADRALPHREGPRAAQADRATARDASPTTRRPSCSMSLLEDDE